MKKILISAGEASGDVHAAHLIRDVKQVMPEAQFFGLGGTKMREQGTHIIIDNRNLGVIGVVEIFIHLKDILAALRQMKSFIKNQKPDLLILVDYPEFNFMLARYAKKHGIKVLYYISPQIWAWRRGRIKKIRRDIDHMAVIFPFEVDFYRQYHINASYVGNPVAEKAKPSLSKEETYHQFKLPSDKKIIALVPGSRHNEIKRIFPTILNSALLLAKQYKNLVFVLPLAPTISQDQLKSYLNQYPTLDIRMIPNYLYDLIQISDAVIAVSGTVTLEIALIGTPMVILYKTSPFTYLLGKMLINVKHIGMCNLIAGKTIVKEFIQKTAEPQAIFKEICEIIDNKNYNEQIRTSLNYVKQKLMLNQHQENAAKIVTNLLS